MWVDSHCHLQLELGATRFDADDADAQVQRAREAGIDWMVCVGTGLETSQQAIDLAAKYDDVYATVGLHPHDASALDAEWDGLVALADSERCVAIGEAGFDLHYEHSPRDVQRAGDPLALRSLPRTRRSEQDDIHDAVFVAVLAFIVRALLA